MKRKILQSHPAKKPKGIRKVFHSIQNLVIDAKTILAVTNRSAKFASLCTLSLAFLIAGIFVASLMGNAYMMPVLAVGFALIPFLYILLSSFGYKKKLNAELETALSIVTAEYIRTEDIVSAIQESLDSCRSPVKEVFQEFVGNVTSVNANVVLALEQMKGKIDSDVFREWVDEVILCQRDRTQKSTLTPIVRKFSEMRTVAGDLNLKLYEPFRNWLIMALALFSVPVLLYALNADWGNLLMHTQAGQIILAVDAAVFFFALIRVIRQTRPIEFRR
ncbi:type II secretion system F family protein [Caproicibacter fermentans]|uniref:Type II secretion system protein GspF domain-containing protein n=1 Tax=Caproicibacter fermentans TaxID=2576756 RepID=A0A7G8TD55_9FIRM|nr:hypothetical protein [Caproicibacter fermentans]QNK41546.1 hypothetical protein HCR03_04590 [Caproicibacter fermentans]